MTREVERPYFHYQNLMHDPRAGATLNVSPSPLASGPADPLVLGYFQIDAAGKVSTPPINDDIPALSEQKRLAANVQFRAEVARGIVASVRPVQVAARDRGTLVASAAQPPPRRAQPPSAPRPVPLPQPLPQPQPRVPEPVPEPEQAQAQAQVVEIDESSYTQNAMPTEIYRQQNVGPRVSRRLMQQQASPPPQQQASSPPPQQQPPLPQQQATPPMQQQASPPPQQRANPPPVQQASPPSEQQASPPVQQASPPSKQQASPPVQQASPPVQQASPPSQQASPPSQQASLPVQQASPPPPKPRPRAAVAPRPPAPSCRRAGAAGHDHDLAARVADAAVRRASVARGGAPRRHARREPRAGLRHRSRRGDELARVARG